ncbi:unnamed protein product [Penicillium salamii]|nr:unnamed protein product [Penicillium salamii]CAG8244211.1 unnamed protein product [Penicillium salamii]
MHARTKPTRHPVLKLLYRRLKDHESFFLSPSSLQDLGIQASQLDITDDGTLKFQPCFFRPYPERVLQLYPLDTFVTEDLPKLYSQPNFASILAEARLKYPDEEYAFKVAKRNYEECAVLRSPDEWETHARETEYYIDLALEAPRKGLPELSSLLELGSLERPRREPTKHDPPRYEHRPGGPSWQMKQFLDNSHENPPLPHAIMATIAHVPANFEPQSLTLHEMRAIVNMLVIRTSHRPFRDYPVHPLLLFSYMGQKHGRIIQASYDEEENWILQYSQLWFFEDEATAPVELFVRYNIAQLVGLERPQLDVPSLRESLTSMNLT